ncbi:MAG: hypothetical protein C0502_00745 [Opitutus sp.]|nr:hypothetical protein [Opitutus sp.]
MARRRLAPPVAAGGAAGVKGAADSDPREGVVLLHGVALSGWVMRPLARALGRAGYRVVNLGYPSRTMPAAQIADRWLPDALRAHAVARAPRLHFVVHSLGSLVMRLHLRRRRPANLGRVVMLGPPNHGSAAADHASRNGFLRWLMGVNLGPLGTGAGSLAAQLGPADFEVGIIAGTGRLNPLFNGVLAGHRHDGVVTLESARLEGMGDFLVVPHSHTAMLWRSGVIAQVLAFLRDGRFARP